MKWRLRKALKKLNAVTRRRGRVLASLCWRAYYNTRYPIALRFSTSKGWIIALVLALLLVGSWYVLPRTQEMMQPHFSDPASINNLSTLFLTIGGALLGATAIVTSLVLFAMQINVERMPYGVFVRLSRDWRLWLLFLAAFVISLGVAILSQLVAIDRLGMLSLTLVWCVFAVLALFLLSYKRALTLINPVEQLRFVAAHARRELELYGRQADRITPLLDDEHDLPRPQSRDPLRTTHDLSRVAFLETRQDWTGGAKRAMRHAVTISRRYAAAGDHEVSGTALVRILEVHHAYIRAKGKTFFGRSTFAFVDPRASDEFLLDTLEHLRQSVREAVARGDEQLIEQVLQTFSNLAWLRRPPAFE